MRSIGIDFLLAVATERVGELGKAAQWGLQGLMGAKTLFDVFLADPKEADGKKKD